MCLRIVTLDKNKYVGRGIRTFESWMAEIKPVSSGSNFNSSEAIKISTLSTHWCSPGRTRLGGTVTPSSSLLNTAEQRHEGPALSPQSDHFHPNRSLPPFFYTCPLNHFLYVETLTHLTDMPRASMCWQMPHCNAGTTPRTRQTHGLAPLSLQPCWGLLLFSSYHI